MLIVCPTCATSYDVDAASLRPNGRQVRCVRCRTVWRPELSQAEKLIAAAEALAPVRRTVAATAAGAEGNAATAEPASGAAAAGGSPAPLKNTGADPQPTDLEVESPPIVPTDLDSDPPPGKAAVENAAPKAEPPVPHDDVETVAARRQRLSAKRKKWGWPLSRLQSGIMALVIVDAVVIGWRVDFVRALPQTASFYASIGLPVNLRGLDFDRLTTLSEQHENVPILVVEGDVVNDAGRIVDVPRLRFAVRNAAHEEIYSWTAVPPRALLSPGEAVAFRTRLASPPPDAHDVLVRFVNRIDMLSGTR